MKTTFNLLATAFFIVLSTNAYADLNNGGGSNTEFCSWSVDEFTAQYKRFFSNREYDDADKSKTITIDEGLSQVIPPDGVLDREEWDNKLADMNTKYDVVAKFTFFEFDNVDGIDTTPADGVITKKEAKLARDTNTALAYEIFKDHYCGDGGTGNKGDLGNGDVTTDDDTSSAGPATE